MQDPAGNRWRSLGWGLAAGVLGIGFLGWHWRSGPHPGRRDPNPSLERGATVVRTTNSAQPAKTAARAGESGRLSDKARPGVTDGLVEEPGLAGKIQRLGAGPVPEMMLWKGICEDWNVPVDLRSYCVWRVFAVTSSREKLRRDVELLQLEMPMVHDAVAADGTEIPDVEGRAKASAVMEKIRRRVQAGTEEFEQGLARTTAELTELTGITDPDFYTRLFAISPRVTLDQLTSGEDGSTGRRGTSP